jgi:hypothetical protein
MLLFTVTPYLILFAAPFRKKAFNCSKLVVVEVLALEAEV